MKLLVFSGLMACMFSLWSAAPGFSPAKALLNQTPGQPAKVENGVFSVENTAKGTFSGIFYNLGGMKYDKDLQLIFEYRVKLLDGTKKVSYVGVSVHSPVSGMSFTSLPMSEKWRTVTVSFAGLKFHKKSPLPVYLAQPCCGKR